MRPVWPGRGRRVSFASSSHCPEFYQRGGDTLLVCEVTPALFATIAANEAERRAPGVTLVDVSMIGVAGRIYLSGPPGEIMKARDQIIAVLGEVEGRDQE